MRRLIKIFLVFVVFLAFSKVNGQQIENGLWNGGIVFSVTPQNLQTSEHCKLYKQRILTNLYQGVAVVKNEYTIVSDTLFTGNFFLPDSPNTVQSLIGNIHTVKSNSLKVLLNAKEVNFIPVHNGYTIDIPLKEHDTISLETFQLIQTSQALMATEEGNKENNAVGFVFNRSGWNGQGDRTAYVQLKDKLTLIHVNGASPNKAVFGDLTHLKYSEDISRDSVFLVWFEGAAPDFKFEKKVMPYTQALFNEIKKFDVNSFDDTHLGIIEKNDFSTNQQSTFISTVYFILFSVPWVILIVFIVYLIFKKKKALK